MTQSEYEYELCKLKKLLLDERLMLEQSLNDRGDELLTALKDRGVVSGIGEL